MGTCIHNRVRNTDICQSGNKAIKMPTKLLTTDAVEICCSVTVSQKGCSTPAS